MSTYALVQRGVISAAVADGAGPKDATLATAIKPGSSFLVARVRDDRPRASVQRAQLQLTSTDVSPMVVTLAEPVNAACSELSISHMEVRATDPLTGVMAHLMASGTDIVLTFGALDLGDTIDVAYEVKENKAPAQATLRLLNANTVRMEWDGTLASGDTITGSYDVFDMENVGDDLKEVLFRLQRMLGYLGENCVQDLLVYDDAGNPSGYRLRVFTSKVNAEAATQDLPDGSGMETGELVRVAVTQDVSINRNDRGSLYRVITDLITTPGVD